MLFSINFSICIELDILKMLNSQIKKKKKKKIVSGPKLKNGGTAWSVLLPEHKEKKIYWHVPKEPK